MTTVLVVDDSVVVRRLIQDALAGAADITVVGTASNGRLAVERAQQLKPDVITMDIEMPEMNGIEAVRELRRRRINIPIIMFSTLTATGATATFDALSAGATDYVTKPANTGSVQASIAAVREQLVPRLQALGGQRGGLGSLRLRRGQLDPRPAAAPAPAAVAGPAPVRRTGVADRRVDVLAIGCSTGGPDALTNVLGALPGSLPVPVVVVQHMPPVFTKMFADRLHRTLPLHVEEASDATLLRPGRVYIAPGDRHLEVVRRGEQVVTHLTDAPPENSCRPAVDVLFRSVAAAYGGHTLVAVLTGMGHDGRAGVKPLHDAGAEVVVQDEATSVVWGMPGAIAAAGLADVVKPLPELGPYLAGRIAKHHKVASLAVTR